MNNALLSAHFLFADDSLKALAALTPYVGHSPRASCSVMRCEPESWQWA
jgi:hypothetical protein